MIYLQGNIDKYKVSLREAVFPVRALGANAKLYFLLLMLNSIRIQKPEHAAQILGAISAFESDNIYPIGPLEKRYYDGAEIYARKELGDTKFDSAFAEGQKSR